MVGGLPLWIARCSRNDNGDRQGSFIFAFRESPGVIETGKRIELGDKGDWIEDPRAISVGDNDGLAVSYTRVKPGCHPSQELAHLDNDLNVVDVWHPNVGGNGPDPQRSRHAEKNWVWFLHEGKWHLIYWLEPMKVYVMEEGTPAYETNVYWPGWMHGIRHGGAHPTRIGDEYFSFCHTLMPWFGSNRSRYHVAAYAFEANPPFKMTRVSRTPLFRSQDDMRRNPCSCVIAGGAIYQDDTWTLAIGAMDEQCLKVKMPHRDVIEGMITL
jgi:hypothetical protein